MNVPAVEDHCTVCGDKNVFTMRYMMDIWEAAHSATHPNATVTYRRRGDPERLPDSGYNEVSLAQTDLSAPYEYDSIVPPFGDTIGLVQAGFDRCLVGRESWEIRDRCNDSILRLLAPGPGAQTIYGFIELNDDWCLYMNNFRYRTDISPVRGFGAREKVRTVVLGAGQMGAQFAVQDPATIDGYARYTERRWVAALHDGRWTWSDVGEPFDFEDTARYTARKKRDRLDRDLVLRYAHALTGAHVERTDLYGRVLLNQ